ncbi:Growth_factor receptor cysteine-rich domain superfamily [Hexamita inflata]|uniref:Growth factor receptor cysteine-rich domain superfamily n=1 Tax=Hexamita inflata TaxID=28002 RepID=A0AA86UP16_9EUKA|nr:Growth factor receptor cysteine-rich domain superfamily [Hexamita inflata]
MCQNSITINSNQYNYCQKTQNLNQLKLAKEMFMSQKYNQQVFLYTEFTKYSVIDLQVSNYNVNSFTLFGFVTDTQVVLDSHINISLNFEVFQGALMCIKCDIKIMNCSFVFIASGKIISALIVEVNQLMLIQQSFIQYRVVSSNSSGLINIVSSPINLSVIDCKLTGGNLVESNYSGYIAAVISSNPNLVSIKNFFVCVSNISALGNQSISLQLDVILQCDICGLQFMVYGLCLDSLLNGQYVSGTIQCLHPFTFTDNQCVCVPGYILDNSSCVNIILAIHNMTNVDNSGLLKRVTDIESAVKELDNSIAQNASQIIGYIQTTQSSLENHIVSNYSALDVALQQNTAALDNRIRGNAALLADSILANASTLDGYISKNSTILDWRIYNNISAMNLSFTNTTNVILERIQDLQYNLTALDNFTKNFQLNQSQQNQQMKLVIISLGQQASCLNNDGKIITGLCLTNYTLNCSDNSSCSQLIYVSSTFDQYFITYSIASQGNFSNGYVFGAAQQIQNSLIDVADNVYSSGVNPLFRTQTSFTNMKIQFGTQSLNGGSLISSQSSAITLNQIIIASRPGSQMTLNPNSQLNILTSSPSGAAINNLLVNLSFAASNGNITLINNINGVFTISGYQVLGDYISTLTVAMIGINVQNATINVNQVNFNPNTYNVGNCSSFLFGSSVSAVSTMVINNLAIIVGNNTNFLLLGSVTTAPSAYYMFGGIITLIDNPSQLSVINVTADTFLKFSSTYISESGFLVGYGQSVQSSITIKNTCLQQNMTSTTQKFNYFGIIGDNMGNTSIQNTFITFSVQGASFNRLGIVGVQYFTSLYSEVINLKVYVSIQTGIGSYIGQVFGYASSKNCSVLNLSVVGGNISSGSEKVGGIFGRSESNSNITVINSSVQNTNISGSQQVGGIIGICFSKLYLTNTKIKFVRLSGTSTSFWVVAGQNDGGTYQFTNSSAVSNFIKGIQQTECASLSNTWSISGC